MEQPLVSMLVLAYNNYRYIYECIDSIFAQNYPAIELIINNDGSNDFNESELIEYVRHHRTENIRKVTIFNEETNVGTVRCANKCVRLSTGKYYMLIAADDALYDPTVISSFVLFYETSPEKEFFVIGKTLMMDEHLEEILFTYPSDEDEAMLYTHDARQLFNVLVQRFFFSMNNIVPRSYFDTYGCYDEAYKLIEDPPFYTKAMCRGTPMYYLGLPLLKHRDGGISHGNKRYSSAATDAFQKDIVTLFEREYLPNSHLLDSKGKNVLKLRYDDLVPAQGPFSVKSARSVVKKVIVKMATVSSRRRLLPGFCAGLLLLLLYQFSDWKNLLSNFGYLIHAIAGYCGLLMIGIFMVLLALKHLSLRVIQFLIAIGKSFEI